MIVRIHLRNGRHHDATWNDELNELTTAYQRALSGYPCSPILIFPGIVVRAEDISAIEESAS